MARDKLATAAIIVCMVAAVSTLPALLIAGSLPQPVVHNYYNTTTTTTPITNTTTNTNVTYYVNGTDTIIQYKCVSCHVEPTMTRTLTNFLNMSLGNKIVITWIRAKTNASIGASGAFEVCYIPVLNGTELVNSTSSLPTIKQFNAYPSIINFWQGESTIGAFMFPTCIGLMGKIGVYCTDGGGTPNPISLAIDLVIFYEEWL